MRLAFYNEKYGGLIDAAIAWWTKTKGIWCPFSHVELVLGDIEDHHTTCISASPRDNCVRATELNLYNGHWFTVDFPSASPIDPRMHNFIAKHLGKKYDWLGVFGFVLDNPKFMDEKKRWFCSEFAAAALQSQGLLDELTPRRTSPNNLFFHLLLQYPVTAYGPDGGRVDINLFKDELIPDPI